MFYASWHHCPVLDSKKIHILVNSEIHLCLNRFYLQAAVSMLRSQAQSKIFNKQSFGRMFVPFELALLLIHQTDSISGCLTTVYFPSRSKADVQGSLYEDQDTGENVAQVILAVKKPVNRFRHAPFFDTTNYVNTCVYEPSFYVHTHTYTHLFCALMRHGSTLP